MVEGHFYIYTRRNVAGYASAPNFVYVRVPGETFPDKREAEARLRELREASPRAVYSVRKAPRRN